jgi:hypothetical protein
MLYEERRIRMKPGSLPSFLRVCREEIWPFLSDHGGGLLALMGGLIGDPMNQLLQVSRFPSFEAWQEAQQVYGKARAPCVEAEAVRPLRQISGRPKPTLPREDQRPIYGVRQFMLRHEDVDHFVHRSEDGVWVRFEALDACILGMWTTIARTEPQEVLLATGYIGVSHWEETRGDLERPPGFDEDRWRRAGEIAAGRNSLVLSSSVSLMLRSNSASNGGGSHVLP